MNITESDLDIGMVFIHGTKGDRTAGAEIDVPGLGKVKFEKALSDDLCKRIETEILVALMVKLGRTVTEDKKEEKHADG